MASKPIGTLPSNTQNNLSEHVKSVQGVIHKDEEVLVPIEEEEKVEVQLATTGEEKKTSPLP